MSICTKGEPRGEAGAESRACPPYPHTVTTQPRLPVPLGASVSPLPGASLLLGGLLPQPCACSGVPPMGLWGPPHASQPGDRARPAHREGGTAVFGCCGRRATPGAGRPSLPTLSFRATLGGLSCGGEGSREGERAPGPLSAPDTGGGPMFPSIPHVPGAVLGGATQTTPARRGLVI